jgi:hypothetical protein
VYLRNSRCQPCHVKARRERYQNDEGFRERLKANARNSYHREENWKNKWKWTTIQKLYGISKEEFEALLITQDNGCAICRVAFLKTPHVDHDHDSGVVRGLLCSRCNTMLGHARDSIEILKAAIEYLGKETDIPYDRGI